MAAPTFFDTSIVALVGAGVGAVAGLTSAAVASLTSQAVARSSRAHTLYNDYLKRCFEHPDLASVNAFEGVHAKRRKPTYDPYRFETVEVEKYHWFMSLMLEAMEQILDIKGGDEAWKRTVSDQVNYHGGYFQGAWRSMRGSYSEALRQIVDPLVPGSAHANL
jgi:hypothetical protein